MLGDTPYQVLFAKSGLDPIGKKIRMGAGEYTVVGVLDKRPSVGNLGTQQDDFVVIPQSTHQALFGSQARRAFRGQPGSAMIAVLPYERRHPRQKRSTQVEEIMRIRHGLTLDEPDDFDVVTQDAALKVWDQVSQATFLGLVVISSIALMVGGIGVMAIMTISVTERTREIGVRKALGARRREILFPVPRRSRGAHLGRRAARHRCSAQASGSPSMRPPASPSRCRGGRSRSASASRPRSASSSAWCPPSARRGSIRSRRCATSSVEPLR